MVNSLTTELNKEIKVCFILGIGRSGTTLLTSLLQRHPEIWACPENYFYLFFKHAVDSKKLSQQQLSAYLLEFNEYFGKIQPYIGWKYDSDQMKNIILNQNSKDWEELSKKIYSCFVPENKEPQNQIKYFVDKNPSYTLFGDQLWKAGHRHFILITRDPRANLLSRKQSKNNHTTETLYNCTRWNYYTKRMIRFQRSKGDSTLLLKYESLVLNPLEETRRVFDFLLLKSISENEINKTEDQFLHQKEFIDLVDSSERLRKKYTDLSQPIYNSRLYAWQSELSSKDIALCEFICGRTSEQLGYNKSLKKIPLGIKLHYYLNYYKVIRALWLCKKEHLLYYSPIKLKMNRARKAFKKRISILYADL